MSGCLSIVDVVCPKEMGVYKCVYKTNGGHEQPQLLSMVPYGGAFHFTPSVAIRSEHPLHPNTC